MDNYQTPIGKQKIRIFGMKLSQVGLLAGLAVVQLAVIVIALKYIVFAPEEQVIPTVTPISLAPYILSTLEPTPLPDLSTTVLTIDDLPDGFSPATPDLYAGDAKNIDFGYINFNVEYPSVDFHPASQSTLYNLGEEQVVTCWSFLFNTPAERDYFNNLVVDPKVLFSTSLYAVDTSFAMTGVEFKERIGELSTGWSMTIKDDARGKNADMVLFTHKNYGGIVKVQYLGGRKLVIGAWEVAQIFDNRLMNVIVNGPIPRPPVISFADLISTTLTLQDLPPGFELIPEHTRVYDPAKRAEWESGGFRIANEFGFVYTRPNLEEVILGYTFQFSDTLSKNAMDTALSSDFMFKALLTEDETGTVESMPVTRPIGDHAYAFTFISPENPEGVRIDCFFFRQGHVGAAIYHAYPRGVWKITLEQMAQVLDAKFKALAAP